jgi:allantoin racemase
MKKKKRILIINPNSDAEMTKAIQNTADDFARGDWEVECRDTRGAPAFIETREDQALAAPGMIALAKENKNQYDAFIIACHCDPNREALHEITGKPVIGIGEASMKIACLLGNRFSIIQTTAESIPLKEELVRKYLLQDFLASVRAPQNAAPDSSDEDRYLSAAKKAIAEDRADVIVLGCAGLTGLDKRMQEELGIPVLDGVTCALILATALIS